MGLSRRVQADLCIIGLSAIWGCTFVVTKNALADISPLLFITVRFVIATLALLLVLPRGSLAGAGGSPSWPAIRGGIAIGVYLFAGFVLQTVGIQYTSPARSAFITSTYVIFTPLLSVLLGMRRPSASSFAGAALAMAGLWLLTDAGGSAGGFGHGELLTLLSAIAFSAHLLAVDHYTRRHDKRAMAFLQVAVVAALGVAPTLLVEPIRFNPTPSLLAAIAITSLLATAFAFLVLNTVQSWTTPTRAVIIFSAEPVFAALTSWAVEGEVLSRWALVGAGLILAGMLTAELTPLARRAVRSAP